MIPSTKKIILLINHIKILPKMQNRINKRQSDREKDCDGDADGGGFTMFLLFRSYRTHAAKALPQGSM